MTINTKFHFEVEVEGDKFEHVGPNSTTFQKAYAAADIMRSYYYGKMKEMEDQQKAVIAANEDQLEAAKEA